MSNSNGLTKRRIEQAHTESKEIWLIDSTPERGGGRLLLRVHRSGSKNFYFRYFLAGKSHVIPMGPYASDAVEGALTLDQARSLARQYSAMHRSPENADVRRALLPRVDAIETPGTASKNTLLDLCNAYVAHLKAQGKSSTARTYEFDIKNHLAPTKWAGRVASTLTMDEATELLRNAMSGGLVRAPAKLRSILHAAYSVALRGKSDPNIPAEMKSFGIQSNPLAGTASLSDRSTPRTRNLNKVELGHFWRLLTRGPTSERSQSRFVKLSLMLGGQRSIQLRRCLRSDVDLDDGRLVIFDPKGRRKKARTHVLPLSDAAKIEVEWWMGISKGIGTKFLFPGPDPERPMPDGSDTKEVQELCDQMMAAGTCTSRFHAQDLRRTAETRMAELGVSKDTRAQIQSHGLGGVQTRHYDMYDYLPEKRVALERWQACLENCAETSRPPKPHADK